MRVELWTDGGCWPNPGVGAWAYVLAALEGDEVVKLASGSGVPEGVTTSNRMEIKAVCEGLGALRQETRLTVFTDSTYLIGMASKHPLPDQCANRGLLALLQLRAAQHDVAWQWIRGHNGLKYNELAHRLCHGAYHDAIITRMKGQECTTSNATPAAK